MRKLLNGGSMNIDAIKIAREKLEFTQQQVSELIGVNRSTYSGWENGYDDIPLKHLIKLCNILKLNIDYITNIIKQNKEFDKYILNKDVLCKNMKQIRINNKKKQDEIASILGIFRTSYTRYENGTVMIPTVLLIQFCKYFNTTIEKLITK